MMSLVVPLREAPLAFAPIMKPAELLFTKDPRIAGPLIVFTPLTCGEGYNAEPAEIIFPPVFTSPTEITCGNWSPGTEATD